MLTYAGVCGPYGTAIASTFLALLATVAEVLRTLRVAKRVERAMSTLAVPYAAALCKASKATTSVYVARFTRFTDGTWRAQMRS